MKNSKVDTFTTEDIRAACYGIDYMIEDRDATIGHGGDEDDEERWNKSRPEYVAHLDKFRAELGHREDKPVKSVTITVERVDVKLLRDERDFLLKLGRSKEIDGLINLLDYMLDKAEGFGGSL